MLVTGSRLLVVANYREILENIVSVYTLLTIKAKTLSYHDLKGLVWMMCEIFSRMPE